MDLTSTRRWLPLSALLIFFGVAYLIFSTSISANSPFPLTSSNHRGFRAPNRNVWAGLTFEEVDELLTFLYDTPNDLNLTRTPGLTGRENDIGLAQLLQPNKSDTVRYLDGPGSAPPRWAHIVVNDRSGPQTRVAEYMVGPLGNAKSIAIHPLTYCHNSGRNYINAPSGVFDIGGILFVIELAANISDITMDLLGGKMEPMKPPSSKNLMPSIRMVEKTEDGSIVWIEFLGSGTRSGEWALLPQGLYVKIEGVGRQQSGMRVAQLAYNGILYDSETDLRAAWRSPDFIKLPRNLPGKWSATEDFEAKPTGHFLPPPIMIQPQGPRYKIDFSEGYVSWMGFTFYLSSTVLKGVALNDVRFNDSRIMYSLELQEALSHYAGSDPGHDAQYWFDAFFGMGLMQSELIPGYDCPEYADFLDTTYQGGAQNLTIPNSICIFEYTADHAISRHTTPFSASVSRNTYLTVRTVATVGNYDYTIDFVFFLDGTIEVKYRASGYIMAAFYPPFSHPVTNTSQSPSPDHDEYGYRIHDSISSAVHTHILNFRADLDIAGESNTFVRTKLEPISRSYPWDQPQHSTRNTMHLTTSAVETESALNWPSNSQEMYVIVNNASRNQWGEQRGYRVMPGTMPGSPSHLAIHNSTALNSSAHWAEADIFVLRQHDYELASSNPMSYLSPSEPFIDFSKMLDDESTIQEDLVIYFNLGNHHVPTTQDIPNTLMHTSGSGVMFVPFNYFDREVSRGSVSGVRIDVPFEGDEEGPGKRVVRRFGGHYEPGNGLEPDLGEAGASLEGGGGMGVMEVGDGLVGRRRLLGMGWMGVGAVGIWQ